MEGVTIGSTTYESYASLAQGNDYMNAQISTAGTVWRAADNDTKGRGLVSGTRFIDRQLWQGEMTDENQSHAFPRTGLTYPDGRAVDPLTVPPEVQAATIELAGIMMEGTDVQNTLTTEPTIQSLKAGSVSISFFRADPTLFSRLPLLIQELLGFWLAGSGLLTTESFGTGRESQFEDEFLFNEGI